MATFRLGDTAPRRATVAQEASTGRHFAVKPYLHITPQPTPAACQSPTRSPDLKRLAAAPRATVQL